MFPLSVLRVASCLTNKNLPKISLWQSYKGIAIPVVAQAVSRGCHPVIAMSNICSVIVQACFTCFNCMPPLAWESVVSPCGTIPGEIRVVIFHSNKRETRVWPGVRLTAEILDYSFTRDVSSSGHVECTSLLFAAVESHLSERQVPSEFFHGANCDTHFVIGELADPAVRWLSGPSGRSELSTTKMDERSQPSKDDTSHIDSKGFEVQMRNLVDLLDVNSVYISIRFEDKDMTGCDAYFYVVSFLGNIHLPPSVFTSQ